MKKAQGLSMTTIVIAALALLVLVVLTLIFTGRLGGFARGVDENTDCQTYCDSIGYPGNAYPVVKGTDVTFDCVDPEKKVRMSSERICCCKKN